MSGIIIKCEKCKKTSRYRIDEMENIGTIWQQIWVTKCVYCGAEIKCILNFKENCKKPEDSNKKIISKKISQLYAKKRVQNNDLKEKISKTFKKVMLAGMMSMSTLTLTYPANMLAIISYDVPGYEYEMNLIKKADELINKDFEKGIVYYKIAADSVEQKHKKIGEGKDVNSDWAKVYAVYSRAKGPPEPEYAEPYLLEAKRLAKHYYEIWKDNDFFILYTSILENLGDIYFNVPESVRNGKVAVIFLGSPITYADGTKVNIWTVHANKLDYYKKFYDCRKIVTSENLTEILHYYKIAKRYYEEYLKFYEENETLQEIIKKDPETVKYFDNLNQKARSNLKIINEVLSKYTSKEETKKEEKKDQ